MLFVVDVSWFCSAVSAARRDDSGSFGQLFFFVHESVVHACMVLHVD